MTFDAGSIEARASVDRSQFQRDLAAMKADAKKFADTPISPKVRLDTTAAKAELDRLKAKLRELEAHEYKIRVRVDQQGVRDTDKLRNEIDKIGTSSRRVGPQASKDLSLIRIALEQGIPPAIALGGGVLAIGAGLAGLGVTGLVAFKGIQAEIKNNTRLGQQYKTLLTATNLEFSQTKQIAASGFWDGFHRGLTTVRNDLPQFNAYIAQSSKLLGDVADHGVAGLIGGFQTFNPLIVQSERYVDSLAQRFDRWANGPGGAQFAGTLSDDLEHAIPALEQLVTLISHLVSAADPIGHVMLDTITRLAAAINSLPVGVLTALLGSYLAFRTISTVTAIVDRATIALGRLAVAETAAAGAGVAGGAAGAAGAGAVLSKTGRVVRGTAIGAILGYLGGNALLGATPDSWNQGGTGTKGGIKFSLDALGDLLSGHWAFGDARGDLQKQYQSQFKKDLAGELQRALDAQWKQQFEANPLSGNYPLAAQRTIVGNYNRTFSPQLGTTPQGYRQQQNQLTQGAISDLNQQTDPQAVSQGYDKITASLTKSIAASQKWFDTSGNTVTLFNGLKVSAAAYYDELKKNPVPGNSLLVQSIMEQRFKTMKDQQKALADLQQSEKRYDDFLATTAARYGLSAKQAGLYAAALGLTRGKITDFAGSSDLAAQAVGMISKQLQNGDMATQQWLLSLSQLDLSSHSLATRVSILGAGLQALQGITNQQAGANLAAASSAETAANALKANSKSVSDNGNLLGQLVKHGKDWVVEQPKLTAGSLAIQQAFAGAGQQAITLAQTIYQNERATKSNSQAVKDAFGAYEGLRRQFISTVEGMGKTHAVAVKLADAIYGIPDKDFEKSLRVGNLPEALAGITHVLTNLNDNLSNILIRLGIDVSNGAELNDVWNKVYGLQGTHEVVLHYTDNLGNNRGGGIPNARGGRIAVGTTGTADDVLVRASKGEWWINARQSEKHNALLAAINSGTYGYATGGRAGDPPPPSLVTTGGGGSGGSNGSGGGGSGSSPPSTDNTKLISKLQGYLSGLASGLSTLRQFVHPVDSLTQNLNDLYAAVKRADAAGYGDSALAKRLHQDMNALKDSEKALADDQAARERWRSRLDRDQQARAAYRGQVRDTFLGQFTATSGNGYAYGIRATLDQAIKTAQKFKTLRARAEKLGLDPKLIELYEQAGPQGEQALEAIVSQGKAYVQGLDKRYEKLGELSGDIGQAAAQDKYGARIAHDNTRIAALTEKIHEENKAAARDLKQIAGQVKEIRREIQHAVDHARKG